jgi:hypothetical protein
MLAAGCAEKVKRRMPGTRVQMPQALQATERTATPAERQAPEAAFALPGAPRPIERQRGRPGQEQHLNRQR